MINEISAEQAWAKVKSNFKDDSSKAFANAEGSRKFKFVDAGNEVWRKKQATIPGMLPSKPSAIFKNIKG